MTANIAPAGGDQTARTQAIYARKLDLTDICLATADDEAAPWGDADAAQSHARLARSGIGEVVVKCGSDGALIGPSQRVATGINPRPVDTTAAGNSFNSAYLAARLSGQDCAASAQAGIRLAGRVIAFPGAMIPHAAMP